LLNPQYKEGGVRGNKETRQIDLVRTAPPDLPVDISFPHYERDKNPGFDLAPNAAWQVLPRGDDGSLGYSIDVGTTHIEKRYVPVPGTYQVKLTVTVENRGDAASSHHFQLKMRGWHDPSLKQGGFMSRRINQTEGLCDVGGKLKKGNLEDLLKERVEAEGAIRWVGIGEQYFLSAAAVAQTPEGKRCDIWALPDGTINSILTMAERSVAAHGKTEYELALFFGPKIVSQLDAVTVGGADAGLGTATEYGFALEWIARPLLAALKAIHVVVPNWGFAIIILTIVLKALTWWPTTQSMKSMKAMAKLKPEIDKLKEKYGNDKERMNVEVMNLYKKHGANPLGGCLPMLIQLPIYFALYSMLGHSVELYRSSWIGWIHDLTAPDPYFVLPVVSGALMFLQQRLSPTPPDPQQKIIMFIMPPFFTLATIFLPSGLALYIFTNTLLTMFQQWWNNRGEKPARSSKPGKPARA
jgi:YidC/Oxa1 family membrane protein insertase